MEGLDFNKIKNFFDIECSNCLRGEGKIREFGCVVTDTSFKILQKGEYVVNPGRGYLNDFHLLNRPDGHDLHLRYEAYDYYRYRHAPEFYRYIPDLDSLSNSPATINFGYAVSNGLRSLDYGFRRYIYRTNIEHLDAIAIDIQTIYNKVFQSQCISLGKTLESIGNKEEEEEEEISYHSA